MPLIKFPFIASIFLTDNNVRILSIIPHHSRSVGFLSPTRVDLFFTPEQPENAKVKPCPKAGVSARIREDLKRMLRSSVYLEPELWRPKERLIESERGWDQALEDLEESKREVDEANANLSEVFMPRKVPEIYRELNSLKKLLANASRELKVKEKENRELRVEIERRKDDGARLAAEDAAVERFGQELENVRIAEEQIKSDHGMRIQELEGELEKRKETELRMADSLAAVTKQLEQTNIALEESKHEKMAHRMKNNKDSNATNNRSEENGPARQITGNHGTESAEEKLARINDEARKLKVELRMSVLAEENSKKAMDDLATTLKEVINESNQGKLKLDVSLAELEHSQREEANLRIRLKATVEMQKKLHDELWGENERLKSTVERLRSKAEESLADWTAKEISFIECIRAAEDEKTNAQQENIRMGETLKAADRMVKSSREENNKLRDILKQALNEASIAKEAASIARAENSQLKDDLAEKNNALNFLTQENESFRTNEAVAMETIRELKKLVNGSSMMMMGEEQRKSKPHAQPTNGKRLGKAFSFNLKEIRVHHHHLDHPKHKENRSDYVDQQKSREDSSYGGVPLRGSIFDVMSSPDSLRKHRRKNSWSAFTSDREMVMSEDSEHNVVDRCRLDGAEAERISRKKVALLRRFGDFMRRRSYSDKTPAF